jgi:hypothetical protein
MLDANWTTPTPTDALRPSAIRYIKLGPGGRWARTCLDEGELHLGHAAVPHDLALTGEREAIRQHLLATGLRGGVAASFAREVADFHTLGAGCLWITFAEGRLWWAFAEPEVSWLGGDGSGAHGVRRRRVIGVWRCTDLAGGELRQESLSTRLTQLAAYRATLCGVQEAEYLLGRLNAVIDPLLVRAEAVRAEQVSVGAALIARLHWADFETLVDLLFNRSGWHRASALGGRQADADLVLEQATTGESTMVQVKSSASQAVLEETIARFDAAERWSRMIFVCHTQKGELRAPADRPEVVVWTGSDVAERAIRHGLFDWLVARVA